METRTKRVLIDLSDNPDDDIRIARMEMELLPWRLDLKDEGYNVVNIEMHSVDSTPVWEDGQITRLDNVTFEVTMHIVKTTNIPRQRKEK